MRRLLVALRSTASNPVRQAVGNPDAGADARGSGAIPFAAALGRCEVPRANSLARTGHAVDLGLTRAPNLTVQEDLVRNETPTCRRNMAPGDGDADIDNAAV